MNTEWSDSARAEQPLHSVNTYKLSKRESIREDAWKAFVY